jgi:ABC-type transport system substrate-binding protein
MSSGNYWDRARAGGVSRRALLQTTAMGAGAAAFLAACGGSSNNGGGSKVTTNNAAPVAQATFTPAPNSTVAQATAQPQAQSKFIPRTNTTAQAVPGGTWASYTTFDATNLDSITSPSFTAANYTAFNYPRLINFKTGASVSADGSISPGFAESWEQPDSTTTILHLRKNAIWDRRAPTNGRAVDSSDVLWTWNKFAAKSPNKNYLVNSVDPNAPIKTMEAPDLNTIKLNQAFPFVPLLAYLGYGNWFRVFPKEAESGFNPETDARGFGPWILSDYKRSVAFTWKKNPDYYLKDQKLPFFDGIDMPIITEYAAGLAQFKAKKVWSFIANQTDVLDTYNSSPGMVIDKNAFLRTTPSVLFFGIRPGSPFNDPRVRQAVSMLVDRDTFIDTYNNVSKFNNAGFGVNVRWHSHISSGEEASWVDPKSPAIGSGQKNFALNQQAAKQLLQAAGQTLPIQTDIVFISTAEYGTIWPQYGAAFKGMLEDSGLFKLNVVNPDYQTEWVPKYVYAKGDCNGISVLPVYTYPDVGGSMYGVYHTNGRYGYGNFQGKQGDPQSDQMIEAQLKEFDVGKRKAIIQQWQQYMANQMTCVPFPGQAETFSLAWPWLSNFGVYRYWLDGWADESYPYLWFDKSKFTG